MSNARQLSRLQKNTRSRFFSNFTESKMGEWYHQRVNTIWLPISGSDFGLMQSPRINKKLVCDALTMALWRRHLPKGVIMHTDRGSQDCSKRYQQLIKDNHLVCSMSGRGDCYDNSVAESYFHSLKVGCLHGQHFIDRPSAQKEFFEHSEIYYNQQRKHSAIGYKIPSQFEALFSLAS